MRDFTAPASFSFLPLLLRTSVLPFLSFRRKRIVIVVVQFIVLKVESKE